MEVTERFCVLVEGVGRLDSFSRFVSAASPCNNSGIWASKRSERIFSVAILSSTCSKNAAGFSLSENLRFLRYTLKGVVYVGVGVTVVLMAG